MYNVNCLYVVVDIQFKCYVSCRSGLSGLRKHFTEDAPACVALHLPA